MASTTHRYTLSLEPKARQDAIVGGQEQYRFTVLTDGLIRYEWAEDGLFEDRASILAVNRRFSSTPNFRLKERAGHLEIITSRFHLSYNKQRFSPHGLSVVIRSRGAYQGDVWRYGKEAHGLHGTARTLDEADGRVPLGPGVASRSGFATLDDSNSMVFDENSWVAGRRAGDRIDGYLFAYGHDYRESVKAFYSLSGSQPLLPRWTLGNWWSRYYAYTAEEYLSLVDRFSEKGIPLSVAVIDIDWHLVKDPRVAACGSSGWTGYTWNKALIPDPVNFLSELHRRKLRTALNDHPADGIHSFEEMYREMAIALNHDTSSKDPIVFDVTDRAFMDGYFDVLLRSLEDQGVDFWWVDWQQGENSRLFGIDPLWVLNHFHFLNNARRGQRPITFSRYAGPGSHRYPVGFSGDTIVTWSSLDFQPEFTATASNIGYGWWSHDIGGHMHGIIDHELLIRWVQLGTFSPILRLHSSDNPWNLKEPWNLRGEFQHIMIEFLQLRHRLIPYLYTMNARSALENEPIVQPMYWAYPDEDASYSVPNQYLFGSELIIAPLTTPRHAKLHLARTRVWLPPGRHVDIFKGTVYDGGRKIWISRSLNDYPVFAREGSIIPLDASSEIQNGGENPEGLEVLLVIGADGLTELVEDDGTGISAKDVDFRRTPLTYVQETGTLQIGPEDKSSSESARRWTIRLISYFEKDGIRVLVDGIERAVQADVESNGTVLTLGSINKGSMIRVELGKDPQLAVIPPNQLITDILRSAEIEMDVKESISKIVKDPAPRTVQISQLLALDLELDLIHALLEHLLADSRGS